MTEDQLTRLLHERTAAEPVGPPPLTGIHRTAVRRRRGRLVVLGAAAAVLLVAGGLAVVEGPDRGGGTPPVATRSPSPGPDLPPGFRWVGVGHAAVAVPDGWGTNALRCGTPTRDTAVVDLGVICLAAFPYPPDTSSVEVRPMGATEDPGSSRSAEVDGHEALLSPMECGDGGIRGVGTCRQRLVLPDLDAVFAAESSRGRDAVSEILSRVTVLEEAVAVPGFNQYAFPEDGTAAADAYRRALREAGFTVAERQADGNGLPPGSVLAADPAPGTMVDPGSTVTVTVTRP